MTKKISVLILALVIVFSLAGCGKKDTQNSGDKEVKRTAITGDVADNLCDEFDADFVYSVFDKQIAYMNAAPTGDLTYCQYYFEYRDDFYKLPDGKTTPGGPWISIKVDNLEVAKQKKGLELLGWTFKTDSSIKMDHFLALQKDGQLNAIYLIINPNRFLLLSRSSTTVITEPEMIYWAAKVAEKVEGELSISIKTNPLGNEVRPWGKSKDYQAEAVGENQKAVVENFVGFLAQKRTTDALNMMDANEKMKQMWQENFQTIESLAVKKIEPVFQEEWTSERQVFKVDLDVQVTSAGEQMGWVNGFNTRWISLARNNNVWQIDEIANNP